MGRAPCCSKVGLHRGTWSSEEDKLLTDYIQTHGEGQWRSLPSKAGLLRCGKSCRLRWMNYLRPGIKRGNFTSEENDVIFRLHSIHGNRWSHIATELPGRTDNEIKNHWNAHLRKLTENSITNKTKLSNKRKSSKNIKSSKDKERQKKSKSKKVKVVESDNSESPLSTIVTSTTSNKNESVDNGVAIGASSSCTFDLQDIEFDYNLSNLMPFLDVESTCTIDVQESDAFLMDDWDLFMTQYEETLMLEKLYSEYQNLINHEENVDEIIKYN